MVTHILISPTTLAMVKSTRKAGDLEQPQHGMAIVVSKLTDRRRPTGMTAIWIQRLSTAVLHAVKKLWLCPEHGSRTAYIHRSELSADPAGAASVVVHRF